MLCKDFTITYGGRTMSTDFVCTSFSNNAEVQEIPAEMLVFLGVEAGDELFAPHHFRPKGPHPTRWSPGSKLIFVRFCFGW